MNKCAREGCFALAKVLRGLPPVQEQECRSTLGGVVDGDALTVRRSRSVSVVEAFGVDCSCRAREDAG
jgi:hypothetical protein